MKELRTLQKQLIEFTKTCDTDTMVALARINMRIEEQIEKLKETK